MTRISLRSPFVYHGGKRRAAPLIWAALGEPRVYVEPFFGSGAVLLSRTDTPAIETVNDMDGLLVHFWRAVQSDPDAVAFHADYPVSEIDLFARHTELVRRAQEVKERLEGDPRWFDAELAGWWAWGASQWIGGGWCADRARHQPAIESGVSVHKKRPAVNGAHLGHGVHSGPLRQMPQCHGIGGGGVTGQSVARGALTPWFGDLAARLRRVRIICGDFERVLTPSCLYVEGAHVAGVFLDPPYSHDHRKKGLYAEDASDAHQRAREWAIAHGDDSKIRIVLAGLEGEHAMPESWRCVPWKGPPGMGRVSGNRYLERLWLSPHCLQSEQLSLALNNQERGGAERAR